MTNRLTKTEINTVQIHKAYLVSVILASKKAIQIFLEWAGKLPSRILMNCSRVNLCFSHRREKVERVAKSLGEAFPYMGQR